MIPTKLGAKYAISYQHPHAPEYYSYGGSAIYNGELDGWDDPTSGFEQWYGFNIECVWNTVFFAERDIIGELKDD